jgi:serine/threonine protein phosphatase PrpC
LEGAGTTLLGAVVGSDRILWISVGDSPLLLYRDGKLNRLNADHSMRSILAGKIAARQMLPGDLATHPERNVLRSALLGGDIEEIDAPEESSMLCQGDILVAASDGLLTLEPPEICRVLKAGARKRAIFLAQELLKKVDAKRQPKQDNTTLAVVKIS